MEWRGLLACCELDGAAGNVDDVDAGEDGEACGAYAAVEHSAAEVADDDGSSGLGFNYDRGAVGIGSGAVEPCIEDAVVGIGEENVVDDG